MLFHDPTGPIELEFVWNRAARSCRVETKTCQTTFLPSKSGRLSRGTITSVRSMLVGVAGSCRNPTQLTQTFRTYSPSIAPPRNPYRALFHDPEVRSDPARNCRHSPECFPAPAVLLSAIHGEGRLKKQANALTHSLYVFMCLNSIVLGVSCGPGYIFIFKPHHQLWFERSRHNFPDPVHRLRSHLSTLIRLVGSSVIVHGTFDHRNRSRLHDIDVVLYVVACFDSIS